MNSFENIPQNNKGGSQECSPEEKERKTKAVSEYLSGLTRQLAEFKTRLRELEEAQYDNNEDEIATLRKIISELEEQVQHGEEFLEVAQDDNSSMTTKLL